MGVTVRDAVLSDYQRIAELTVGAFMGNGMPASSPYAAHLRDVESRAEQSQVLVAVDDDSQQVVGAVAFVRGGSPLDDMCRDGESEFRMLAVDPKAQGTGAGRALVARCLSLATADQCSGVVIGVTEKARAARRLYERFGFVRVPDRDVELDDGPRLLAYRLSLSDSGRSMAGS